MSGPALFPSSGPMPVVLCGKRPDIFKGVQAMLLPEFEAIHFIMSVEQGHAELPALFTCRPLPTEAHENHGTGNYARPPALVVAGPGFDDDEFRRMHDGCSDSSHVPWLQPDSSQLKLAWADPAFPGHLGQKVKECIRDVVVAGKMGMDGVYSYKL